jgi:hypothetical protein
MRTLWYVLTLPEALRLQVGKYRTERFRETGETTLRLLPPVVFIAKGYDDVPIDDAPCPDAPATFGAPRWDGSHLVVPVEGLGTLSEALGGTGKPVLYIGDARLSPMPHFPSIDDFRLALLEIKERGKLVTWSTLWEKHLWTGKG